MHSVENLILGIRYSRSFRIPDISGEIVDEILYGNNTPFGPDVFPNLNDYSDEKILHNKQTGNFIRINSDDLILRITVKNFDKDFTNLLEKQVPYVVNNVIMKFGIKNILRFGMVFRHKFSSSSVLEDLVKNFTTESIQNPNNVSLSFSKKLESSTANLSGIDDYVNTIHTFAKIESGMIAELDFQKYFIPPREDIRDAKIDTFINEARRYVVNNFHPLLRTYNEE